MSILTITTEEGFFDDPVEGSGTEDGGDTVEEPVISDPTLDDYEDLRDWLNSPKEKDESLASLKSARGDDDTNTDLNMLASTYQGTLSGNLFPNNGTKHFQVHLTISAIHDFGKNLDWYYMVQKASIDGSGISMKSTEVGRSYTMKVGGKKYSVWNGFMHAVENYMRQCTLTAQLVEPSKGTGDTAGVSLMNAKPQAVNNEQTHTTGGTEWLTLDQTDDAVYLSFQENTTGASRTGTVTVERTGKGATETSTIKVMQLGVKRQRAAEAAAQTEDRS